MLLQIKVLINLLYYLQPGQLFLKLVLFFSDVIFLLFNMKHLQRRNQNFAQQLIPQANISQLAVPQNSPINEFYVVQKRSPLDFKPLKTPKVWSGQELGANRILHMLKMPRKCQHLG